jgi:hypothetical protein
LYTDPHTVQSTMDGLTAVGSGVVAKTVGDGVTDGVLECSSVRFRGVGDGVVWR